MNDIPFQSFCHTKNQSFDHTKKSSDWEKYQLLMLNKQIEYAKKNSVFYSKRLSGLSLSSIDDLSAFPFMLPSDISKNSMDMICSDVSEIKRVVTLRSSGTSGPSKRIYFSKNDIERTISFFSEGMQLMCSPDDTVIIFMPGDAEDGIGQLLARGLSHAGEKPYIFGAISEDKYTEAAECCLRIKPHTIVGIPSQMRKLSLLFPNISPENILLSADYISPSLKSTIERVVGCEVFSHYGLTETGLGCAVDCGYHSGMHIRQDELYVEIIDPVSLLPMPSGMSGEIVITTLRREAMPLIRYRTGDIGKLIDEKCKCGSELLRLDSIRGRLSELSKPVSIMSLDDTLFSIDSLLDYSASAVYNPDVTDEIMYYKISVEGDENAVKEAESALKSRFPDAVFNVEQGLGIYSTGTKKRTVGGSDNQLKLKLNEE